MRHHLTDYAEQRKVHDHILKVTEMVKSEHSGVPYVQYRGDWDDQKVGELFGFSKFQIREFRQKHIGFANPGAPGKPHGRIAMLKRIEALEGRFNALENLLAETYGSERPGFKRLQKNGPLDDPQPF